MLDPDWVTDVRRELAWAGRALGEVRDLDVLLGHLDQDAQHLPAEQRHAFDTLTVAITSRREQARKRMLKTLRAPRYMRLLDRLEGELIAPPSGAQELSLERIAGDQFERLGARDGRAGPRSRGQGAARRPQDHQARALRRRAGRAGTRAQGHAVHRRHQACCRTCSAIIRTPRSRSVRSASWPRARSPEAAFAAGMLAERQRERRRVARAAYPRAWKAVRKRGRAAWS